MLLSEDFNRALFTSFPASQSFFIVNKPNQATEHKPTYVREEGDPSSAKPSQDAQNPC